MKQYMLGPQRVQRTRNPYTMYALRAYNDFLAMIRKFLSSSDMQQLCLISVALFAIHQQHSLFQVDGGCPASEKNGKQDWRFAVFERKEKGTLKLICIKHLHRALLAKCLAR